MTRGEKIWKTKWFLIMIAYFAVGYLSINWIASHRTSFLDVSISFDGGIPFIPIFVLGYAFAYIGMILAYLVVDNTQDWQRAIISYFIATSLCYAFFLILPVRMEMRPDLMGSHGTMMFLTKLFYYIDMPYNCFPSLHVTCPTLATLIVWKNHPRIRYAMLAMALIVAVSVIFVKQHYIADVIAGFITAALSYWIAVIAEKYWSRWFCKSTNN